MRATWSLALATVVSLAGCAAEDPWPVRPPGGGGTGSGTGGTGTDAGTDGGGSVSGRLCVVDDLTRPDACPVTDADEGVTVRVVGGPSTTTDASGGFTLPAPTQPQVIAIADDSTVLEPATAQVVPGGGLALRAMRATAFDDLVTALQVTAIDGLGTIVLYVDDAAGDPLAGVLVEPVAGATFVPLYDDGGGTSWRSDLGTGADGVALVFGVQPGVATVNATAPGAAPIVLAVPVRSDAITFVRTAAP